MPPDEPNSGSTEAQLLLKLLACVVAQSPPAHHALWGALAGRNIVLRGREIGVNFAGAGQTQARDLPAGIDGATSE